MSGSPGGLRAVLTVAAASSIGAASGSREASRDGGKRHPRIPFCGSGLQAGCGRTSQCSTRHTDIQQQVSAAQRVPGPARHLGALAVTLPTGCLQPVGFETLWHGVRHAAPLLRKSGHLRFALTPKFEPGTDRTWIAGDWLFGVQSMVVAGRLTAGSTYVAELLDALFRIAGSASEAQVPLKVRSTPNGAMEALSSV